MSKVVKLPSRQQPNDFESKFPIEGEMKGGVENINPPNGYFIGMSRDQVQKKHLQYLTLMEYLNTCLGLNEHATMQQFGERVRDLFIAVEKLYGEKPAPPDGL